MKNMTLKNITAACHGKFFGEQSLLDITVDNVVIDSRKAQPGSLFVAIDGAKVNAHKFVPDVIAAGALCVVVHEDPGEVSHPYILVESTGQALLDIAKFYRDSFPVKVVGITGSVGKTSTKEMIASVLSQKYCVHKTIGNFNNEWGLPLTIFEMNESHEIAVLEMGVNHFGEMRRLSSVSSPDICVITNIGVAHLEFFRTREGILEEKTKMILDMKPGGTILLNGDDDLLRKTGSMSGTKPLFFGTGDHCQFTASDIIPLGLRGTSCTITLPDGESFACTVPTPGAHMISNALAGTSVGYTLGLTTSQIKAGIENLPSLPGRNHIFTTDRYVVLDDCYNANPISTRAALDVLNMAIGRKVAILGDMGELGENARKLHYETGEYAASTGIDLILGIGTLAEEMVKGAREGRPKANAFWFPTKDDFFAQMDSFLKKEDNILVKASHGMAFEDIVDRLK